MPPTPRPGRPPIPGPRFWLPLLGILLTSTGALWLAKRAAEPPGAVTGGAEGVSVKGMPAVGDSLEDLWLTPLAADAPKRRLSEAGGSRVTVLNLWATWCAPCVVELPSLVRLRERFASRGLEVVLVNVDEDARTVVPAFIAQRPLPLPLFIDPEMSIFDRLDISTLPVTLVLDGSRKVLFRELNSRDWDSPRTVEKLEAWLAPAS